MGKATRWLKGLFGIKKDKDDKENNSCKKWWSFVKSGKDLSQIPVHVPASDSPWLRSFIADSEKEQNKHAIAVAAATAAAADAAVAAAQAAAAVVRLTSQGRGALFSGGRERWAAVKIQNVFRGYLARKALRALKGLVKLQALVRGYLVRKRAAATLHSMQALIRAQASIRARRSTTDEYRIQPEMRSARKSTERYDESRTEFHSTRFSTSCHDHPSFNGFDESPKIVEMDTCRGRSRSRRMSLCMSEYADDHCYPVLTSPLPCRLSIPDCRHLQDFDWGFIEEEDYKYATAQNTPRFTSSGRTNANVPITPAKSLSGDAFFRPYSNFPNYMANTHSFRAKLRSHSAPKQRPEPGPKKRLSLHEIMASRTSFSGVRMQRSCSQQGFEP